MLIGRKMDPDPDMPILFKQNKYNSLAQRVGGQFIPTIIERFGTFGDALVGLIKTLTGEAQRDPLIDDDHVFSTSSRTTYVCCFAAVLHSRHRGRVHDRPAHGARRVRLPPRSGRACARPASRVAA